MVVISAVQLHKYSNANTANSIHMLMTYTSWASPLRIPRPEKNFVNWIFEHQSEGLVDILWSCLKLNGGIRKQGPGPWALQLFRSGSWRAAKLYNDNTSSTTGMNHHISESTTPDHSLYPNNQAITQTAWDSSKHSSRPCALYHGLLE